MEDIWLARAKRLQAIASTGMHYGGTDFDRERYQEIADLAHAMLADLGDVPLARIKALVPDFAAGYATPKVDVRGAVIEAGRILLVQEKTDGRWSLPGGFADVGISPADNVVKEIREESGLEVSARHIYRLRHKARHGYPADARDFYKLFFLCVREAPGAPVPGPETLGAAFFDPDDLPPLSLGRVLEADIHEAFAFDASSEKVTPFD